MRRDRGRGSEDGEGGLVPAGADRTEAKEKAKANEDEAIQFGNGKREGTREGTRKRSREGEGDRTRERAKTLRRGRHRHAQGLHEPKKSDQTTAGGRRKKDRGAVQED